MADLRDAHCNPLRQTDEYGNTIGGATGTGEGGYVAPEGVTPAGRRQETRPDKEHQGVSGVLHRSRSSSSSSSEDDGMGGRRKKKGLKEKIKEKLPGGNKSEEQKQHVAGYAHEGGQAHEPEKKGVVEKIKEKLPGHH